MLRRVGLLLVYGSGFRAGVLLPLTLVPALLPVFPWTPWLGFAGRLVFPGYADFRPNLTPKEVLQAGSFGGTYFRRIHSGVTGQNYEGDWREFPADWFAGLQESQVCAQAPQAPRPPARTPDWFRLLSLPHPFHLPFPHPFPDSSRRARTMLR